MYQLNYFESFFKDIVYYLLFLFKRKSTTFIWYFLERRVLQPPAIFVHIDQEAVITGVSHILRILVWSVE